MALSYTWCSFYCYAVMCRYAECRGAMENRRFKATLASGPARISPTVFTSLPTLLHHSTLDGVSLSVGSSVASSTVVLSVKNIVRNFFLSPTWPNIIKLFTAVICECS
jgi:hypothetical protein